MESKFIRNSNFAVRYTAVIADNEAKEFLCLSKKGFLEGKSGRNGHLSNNGVVNPRKPDKIKLSMPGIRKLPLMKSC